MKTDTCKLDSNTWQTKEGAAYVSGQPGYRVSQKQTLGTGETAQQLKAHTTVPENQSSVPTLGIKTPVTPAPRDLTPSSGLHGHPLMHNTQTYTHKQTNKT